MTQSVRLIKQKYKRIDQSADVATVLMVNHINNSEGSDINMHSGTKVNKSKCCQTLSLIT